MSTTEPEQPTTVDPAVEQGIQTHPDIPVIGPLTGSWTCTLDGDEWSWSDEVYAIHGFAPGEVVPTTELVLRHIHPDDRDKAMRALTTARELGTHFSHDHRVIDAHNHERRVLTVGSARTDDEGRVVDVHGYMVDLTESRRRDLEPAVQAAIENAMEHRGAIDMAKGALMLGYGVDADEAFDILRAASNRTNLKLNGLAHRLVHEMALEAAESSSGSRIQRLMDRVTASDDTDE